MNNKMLKNANDKILEQANNGKNFTVLDKVYSIASKNKVFNNKTIKEELIIPLTEEGYVVGINELDNKNFNIKISWNYVKLSIWQKIKNFFCPHQTLKYNNEVLSKKIIELITATNNKKRS